MAVLPCSAQVLINEASGRNFSQVADEDNETKDWFELYNSSDDYVNLEGWAVTDDNTIRDKWIFPSVNIGPKSFLLVFASGKGRKEYFEGDNWQSPVLPSHTFNYLIPDSGTPSNWNTIGFDDQLWSAGKAGFGYGDNDDNTVVPEGTLCVYIRKSFTVPDVSALMNVIAHFDYDDGFVAYLNGTEICRNYVDGDPSWNSYASAQHDAVMFSGGQPEGFNLDWDVIKNILVPGENVFAVEVHNLSSTSSDLSMIPFFSLLVESGSSFFDPAPAWISGASGGNLHTNFKIDTKGEPVFLYKNDGSLADSLYVARTPIDYSVGRKKDGDPTIAVFKAATPGRSNNNSKAYTDGYEATPIISPESGFYKNAVEVSLHAYSSSAIIRYTTDGSEPTTASTVYNGDPIILNESKVINARCFSTTGKLDGITATASFIIDTEYTIPVLSVVTNNANLYGSSGIFSNWSQTWNKPCFVEYFDEKGNLAFRQEAGIQVDGGAGGSRSQPQHSFRIEPDHGTFGAGSINYRLFPDRPERTSFASFYVRNGSNQYLILPYKDATEVKGMGKNTFTYYSAYRPIAVHINGEFFGIYELREKINSDFLLNNYGINIDTMDFLGVSYFKGMWLQATEGSIDGYVADLDHFKNMDPGSANFLNDVGKFLDLDNYTDYMIGETWIPNTDWPQNNIKVFRCAGTDYKWHFALVDLEWALRPNQWSDSNFDQVGNLLGIGESNDYTIFWYKMMQVDAYKYRYLNRFADLMNTNYHFDNIGAIEQAMYDEVFPEMHLEYERWGSSNIEAQMDNYTTNHNIFRSELKARSAKVRSHLENHFNLDKHVNLELDVDPPDAGRIRINTIIPASYSWRGIYFTNVPISIQAIPNPGYVFTGWKANPLISDLQNPEIVTELSSSITYFTAYFEEGTSDFDGVSISEINYKIGEGIISNDWFEIFNSTVSDLDLSGWYFTDNDMTHRYDFESNTRIPAGGRIVVAQDIELFEYFNPEVSNFTGGFDFGLDSYGDEINLFNSAGDLVVSVNYSNNYPWPLNDNTEGRTLELADPNGDLNDPYNWIAGCPNGSPGKAYEKCLLSNTEEEITASGIESSGLIKAWPNPTEGLVNIELSLPGQLEKMDIKVYNILGSLVLEQSTGSLLPGDQLITVDLSNLEANQLLYLQLQAPGFRETIKIVRR